MEEPHFNGGFDYGSVTKTIRDVHFPGAPVPSEAAAWHPAALHHPDGHGLQRMGVGQQCPGGWYPDRHGGYGGSQLGGYPGVEGSDGLSPNRKKAGAGSLGNSHRPFRLLMLF